MRILLIESQLQSNETTKREKALAVRPSDLRRLWLRVRPPARWRALGGLLVALGIVRNEQESAPRARKGSLVTCFNTSIPAIIELELETLQCSVTLLHKQDRF